MATLKSETRIKEIDTTRPESDASEYGQGDVVYDANQGLMRHDGSAFEGIQATFDGLVINSGTLERVINNAGPSETVELYDCSAAHIFYNYNPSGDWVANFVNFKINPNTATTMIIRVNQAGTPYIPDRVTISQTSNRSLSLLNVLWVGGEKPTPTANGTDVFCFTVFQLTNTSVYYVLAQMVPFKALG